HTRLERHRSLHFTPSCGGNCCFTIVRLWPRDAPVLKPVQFLRRSGGDFSPPRGGAVRLLPSTPVCRSTMRRTGRRARPDTSHVTELRPLGMTSGRTLRDRRQ
ncbi:hypothetical protein GDO78_022932, partial [Eleutherodactylus coqui]